jgi:hypothetical protein
LKEVSQNRLKAEDKSERREEGKYDKHSAKKPHKRVSEE